MNKLDLLRPKKHFIVAALLLVTSTVSLVVTESPWYVLYTLTPALVLIGRWYWPQCIRRRIKLLSEGANVN
jgi:Flp pilus assembly protein TadB